MSTWKYLSAAAIATTAYAADDKCRTLVLSGGASYGAWEAGVVWGLTHYGNPSDFTWDVISGVSAGSINAGGIVLFDVGDEVTMSEWLSDKWAALTTD